MQIINDMYTESATSVQAHEGVTEDFQIGICLLLAPRVNFQHILFLISIRHGHIQELILQCILLLMI